MALHIDEKDTIQIITPPKTLTDKERKILEESPVNKKLIEEAMSINFNIVNGQQNFNNLTFKNRIVIIILKHGKSLLDELVTHRVKGS